MSLRSRRRRTVAGSAVLALGLGGVAVALPAQARAGSSATAAGGVSASGTATPGLAKGMPLAGSAGSLAVKGADATGTSIPIQGGSPPRGGTPVPVFAPTITDSLNLNDADGNLSATDAILTCAPAFSAIGGTYAVTVPLGCLTLYNGEWIKVTWTGGSPGVSTDLAMGTNGNLTLTPGNTVKPWASNTTFPTYSTGPGCLAQFSKTADDLVVDNCDGASLWNSTAHTYAGAVLAFQEDGNLVVYESSAGTALWATGT